MTIPKDTKRAEDRMDKISESMIQKVDLIESEDEDVMMDDQLEAELEKLEDDVADDVGDISRPKVTLRFRSAKFTHLWDLNSTNKKCLCERELTSPTEADLKNRATYSNYIVSRCGCAYHTTCIREYIAKLDGIDSNDMVNCPLCKTKYEPLQNDSKTKGVYETDNK